MNNTALLNGYEKPVKLLNCSKGYWVMLPDGSFDKDKSGNLIVITKSKGDKGKDKFKSENKDDILKHKIELEEKKIINAVIKKTKEILSTAHEIFTYAEIKGFFKDVDYSIANIVISIEKSNGTFDEKSKKAKKIATKDYIEFVNKLQEELTNENYDYLHILLMQYGIPLIATIDNYDTDNALIDKFKANNIEETLSELKNNSHIRNVAKFNVLKTENV